MADSVYGQILDAVKTLVATIPSLSTAGQVVVRKRLAYLSQYDTTLPFVCIAPTVERYADSYMSNADLIDYPVQIAIIQQGNLGLLVPDTMLYLREQIRQKLRTPTLSGAAAVYDVVGYDPNPAFDMQGFDAALEVSVQQLTYRAAETRNQ